MEYMPCNLLELLEAQPPGAGLERASLRLIMRQLITGIAFLHSRVRRQQMGGQQHAGCNVTGSAVNQQTRWTQQYSAVSSSKAGRQEFMVVSES
jgi:hypothetical protein